MAFVSDIQPLCRYCGCGIGKHTTTVWFDSTNGRLNSGWFSYRPEKPTSKAEAQALLNQQIVSVRWATKSAYQYGDDEAGERLFINQVTIWDGVSYRDEFFCKDEHAKLFGYAAARGG
ncbi:hypothetical protein CcrColossus_gp228 [Caulobacter phage CcrColossus]|uniref:Uncharacterized protein n=1 Tax=Caulobacter phage CcrColossus TaxID=1211640 RepID=K4JW38_9CAUD|nr:hypothetical protein CcrColossus_gp228 [Caulobacter phage CcrColossus]AFU88098.1 hypothetical protein CcrColossus_gp228 [Caulobacter phage CcrColossus]